MTAILLGQPFLTVLTLKEVLRRSRTRLRVGVRSRWSVVGAIPDRLAAVPPNLRPGDALVAEAIYAGRFQLAGSTVTPTCGSVFEASTPSVAFQVELHGFEWLRHHAALADALSSQNARVLVDDWIGSNRRRIKGPAFDAPVVARRVISWITYSNLLLIGADYTFRQRFLKSLATQTRLLRSVVESTGDGLPRLTVRLALAFASLALPFAGGRSRCTSEALSRELDRQFFQDGGHFSRDPSAGLAVLPDLIALREAFIDDGKAPPKKLYCAIDRLLPMLRFFSHSDGSLALFNGSGAVDPRLLGSVMRFDETLGSPLVHARQSGYHRIAAGQSVVIADTGCPPPIAVAGNAHAGTLAFELSCGANRIVVNCGRPSNEDIDWRRLSRATAAHSTVTVADRSSSRFARSTHLDRFLGNPLVPGPTNVPSFDPTADGLGFEAIHDGYEQPLGVLHRRRMVLSADGDVVDGVDRLERSPKSGKGVHGGGARATARFHLHPSVVVDRQGEEIRLSVRGQAWLFAASETVLMEDSIFFADPAGARRTQQLVVPFGGDGRSDLAWRFRRVA